LNSVSSLFRKTSLYITFIERQILSSMVDSAFNKYRGKAGHGTLIGNW